MKRCPECRRDYYDETLLYCLDDGTPLLEGPSFGNEQPTAIIDPAESKRTGILTDAETRVFETTERRRNPIWIYGAVAIGVLLVAGLVYALYFKPTGSDERSTRPAAIQVQRLTGDGRTRSPVISPDGKFLVFVKPDEGKHSLWIKQIVTGSTVNVVKAGEAQFFHDITFSPDGGFVYFNANFPGSDGPTIYRVATLGSAPVKFLSNAQMLQFSADGKFISFRRVDIGTFTETLFVANADGSNERPLASRTGIQFFSTPAAWSPDGKLLAVGTGEDAEGGRGSTGVSLVDVASGAVSEFGERKWEGVESVVWHPSGDSLFVIVGENSLMAGQVWELSYPAGKYRKLTNNLNGHYNLSITADGKSMVTGEVSARSAVWVSPDLKAENAKQVMPSTGDTWGLSWTPDNRIVYISDQTGDTEVWIMNADGTEPRQLTNDRVAKVVPTVSPDGKYIVYTSSQNGGQLVRINIDGGNPLVLTKAAAADNAHISPDSRWVIYSAYVEGPPKVLRVSIDGGEEQVLTPYPAQEPKYSNDGTRFACFLLDEKTLEWNRVGIVPAEGGTPIATIDVPRETYTSRGPAWTPDDKNLALVIAQGERQNLWLQPVGGGAGRAITDFALPGVARREYSRDGKRIAIVRAEGIANAIMITDFR
jgi:TolB protein